MSRKVHVVAGPYRSAQRYAVAQGWDDDEYIIVTRGHQIARLDPARIAGFVAVRLHTMADRVVKEIQVEVSQVLALWPVPTVAAA